MQLIKNNPYRIIGLLAGATAREQDKQIRRLKQYLAAEQEPEGDYSFPTLGKLDRTLEDVTEASSKLNLDNDKMTAALFWFWNGHSITDDPAFDNLKDGQIKDAVSIWAKLTNDKEVDKRNASAFHNISNLLLNASFQSKEIKIDLFEKGVRNKLKLLESEFSNDFITQTTDEYFRINKEQIQLIFLRLLQNEVERHGGISTIKFLEIINDCEFAAKEEFIKEFVNKPIEQIEQKITDTRNSRKANKIDAIKYGTALFNQTKESLTLLKSVLSSKSIKYISISDKVSEEILQCGIDYFKENKDSENDPGQVVMNLLKAANSLACGNIAKQRCTENIENLQEWINDKPERDKQNKIKYFLENLLVILISGKNNDDTINNAESLINQSKPFLIAIRNVLGSNDSLYLKLSTEIAVLSQYKIIDEVNVSQENIQMKLTFDKYSTIQKLKATLERAWKVTCLLSTLDVNSEFKRHRDENKKSLMDLCSQLEIRTTNYTFRDPERAKTPEEQEIDRINNQITYKRKQISELQIKVIFEDELNKANQSLQKIKNCIYFPQEINNISQKIKSNEDNYNRKLNDENYKLESIKGFQLFRSSTTKMQQIEVQEKIIREIKDQNSNTHNSLQQQLKEIQLKDKAERDKNIKAQQRIIDDIVEKGKVEKEKQIQKINIEIQNLQVQLKSIKL